MIQGLLVCAVSLIALVVCWRWGLVRIGGMDFRRDESPVVYWLVVSFLGFVFALGTAMAMARP